MAHTMGEPINSEIDFCSKVSKSLALDQLTQTYNERRRCPAHIPVLEAEY